MPSGFSVHRKLKPQLERRRETLGDEGGIDWAQAEALAFASLLVQGTPIRLTGQDTERGTFSQRHLSLHDTKTGEKYTPIQDLKSATAPFELHNSPLSEIACLGFEYGYSVQAPEALVLWEAQFGDFVNAAQVVIDQFLVSGLAKWGQTSRLTLLLPHGYEGSGPEHSSGRVERFLQLAAEGNIRVANVTTPAQYFHLLRRQALVQKARPLVVMTPKSLLRLPAAASHVDELADGGLQVVIDDPDLPSPREDITKLVLCTGKVYYDIVAHEERPEAKHVAVARVELLYPFAENELRCADRELPEPEARDVGAGGAAQHGRARLHAPPPGADPAEGHGVHLRRARVQGQPGRGLRRRAPHGAAPDRRGRARRHPRPDDRPALALLDLALGELGGELVRRAVAIDERHDARGRARTAGRRAARSGCPR